MRLESERRAALDQLIKEHGYSDYKWIDPAKIIVAQWVRMKCMFGCSGYGRCAVCPPNTLSVAENERFFNEYNTAVILHFEGKMDKPEDRHAWAKKINAKLVKLERAVFLAGFERAFQLFMAPCRICKECTGRRETCQEPGRARPTPEAMAVDVFSTARQFDFPINVRTEYDQNMDRYAFLMIQ
jgi:predicted metal-binding protein